MSMILTSFTLDEVATTLATKLLAMQHNNAASTNNDYYSSIEVAQKFKVTKLTVFNWRKANKIPFTKIGKTFVYHKATIDNIHKPILVN